MRFLLFFLTVAGLASATTYNVTTTTDSNGACTATACSLREAIIAANADTTATAAAPHIINVPAGTYLLTISGAGEDLSLTGDLDLLNHITIHGAAAQTTIVDGGWVSGGATGIGEQVFHIPASGSGSTATQRDITVRFENLTIRGGGTDATNITGVNLGPGALKSWGANVTVSNCVLSANLGAAVTTESPQAAITVNQSTFVGNLAGVFPAGKSTITNSTFTGNTGCAFLTSGVTSSLTNVTFSGNGAGICPRLGTAYISHSTFVANTGDIYLTSQDIGPVNSPYPIYLKNSILASTIPCIPFDSQFFNSLGNNLYNNALPAGVTVNNCAVTWQSTDRAVPLAKLKLEALGANGGPTMTVRLLPGSTAIDSGVCGDAFQNFVATDQRGVSRPQDGNGNGTAICDVGAYEVRTPETTVDAIAAYNNGIKHGTLSGVGTGSQITTNQATFLSYLTTADTNVHANNYPAACSVLKTAVQASDGKTAQPDLITGSGLAAFNALLVAVRTGLGC